MDNLHLQVSVIFLKRMVLLLKILEGIALSLKWVHTMRKNVQTSDASEGLRPAPGVVYDFEV